MDQKNGKQAIRAVFFDCDGTLIDTVPFVVASKIYAFEKMMHEVPPYDELVTTIGLPLEHEIGRYYSGEDAARYESFYREYQMGHQATSLGIFIEAYRLMKALWEREIPVGMVTSRRRPSTLELLEMFHVKPYFSVMVNPIDTARSKPNPDPLIEAIRRMNETGLFAEPLRPEECAYVGDAHHDMVMAKAAGAQAILVDWTRMPDEVLADLDLDARLSDHQDLLEMWGFL